MGKLTDTNPDPITTAREALKSLLKSLECKWGTLPNTAFVPEMHITAALDYAEKLKIEDEILHAANAEFSQAAIESHAEVLRLTSQLEQAEKVIKPFADAALSPGGRRWGLTVTAERLFEGEESSPLPKTDDFLRAEKWIKDRQAKGEG